MGASSPTAETVTQRKDAPILTPRPGCQRVGVFGTNAPDEIARAPKRLDWSRSAHADPRPNVRAVQKNFRAMSGGDQNCRSTFP